MKTGTALLLLLSLCLAGCSSSIKVYEGDVLTRKFGPSDLKNLGGSLMERLGAATLPWMQDMPRVAIADFHNATDMPGLNKQPFFDEIETAMFRMNKFDLIDHRATMELLKEANFQQTDAFNNETAVAMGQAVRAKYIMWGDISVSADIGADDRTVKEYRLSLKVTDVESHRIVYRDTETAQVKGVK